MVPTSSIVNGELSLPKGQRGGENVPRMAQPGVVPGSCRDHAVRRSKGNKETCQVSQDRARED